MRAMMTIRTLAALMVLGLLASSAEAQRFRGPDRELSKNGNSIKDAFRSVVADANASTVKVRSDGRDIAHGTIVDEAGFILTKASELTGTLKVRLRDGTEKDAVIVGVAEDHDLAMLKIKADDLTPIEWADAKKANVGQWVITPGMADSPMALGVLSVGRRKIPARSGLLGVMLADGDGGAKVMQVVPDSPAEKAGLRVDDVIASVNSKDVSSREALIETIRSYMPGQIVKLAVKRGDKEIQVEAKLVGGVGPGARAEMMNQMGGPLSLRNANFPAVLQHDTVLTPSMCGGPLVTLDGKAIGINIARAGRVESFAIPSDVIEPLLKDLRSGKLAPKSQETPTTKPAEKKNEE